MTEFRHLPEYSKLRNRSQIANYLACLEIHGQIIKKCTKKDEMKLTHNAATTTTELNRDQLQTRKERIGYEKEQSFQIIEVGYNMNDLILESSY